MNLRKRNLLMNVAEAITSTAAPAAPTPAAAPAPAAAAPAPAADESLLPPLDAAAPPATDAPSTATDHGWLPEKFRVNAADGKLDLAASSQKLSDSYKNLERTRGAVPPAAATDYQFTPPEEFKDVQLDDALSAGFRERAHKAGLSQAQYEMVMGEYFTLVPELLNGAAQASAAEARAELSKVWASPAQFDAQVNNAARAISGAPEHLRADLHAKFGRDPLFLQFAASLGQSMREDRAPTNPDGGPSQGDTLESLMRHPAYSDPKHPEHASVSQRAMKAAQRMAPG